MFHFELRTVDDIIHTCYRLSARFSVSNDLRLDAQRDLADIGADIKVYCLSKVSRYVFAENSFFIILFIASDTL